MVVYLTFCFTHYKIHFTYLTGKYQPPEDTWKIESGFNGLTNYFKKKNFDIYVINSDGKKYTEKKWMFSQSFNFLDKNKSIISDKHIRKYLLLNSKKQKIAHIKSWGL